MPQPMALILKENNMVVPASVDCIKTPPAPFSNTVYTVCVCASTVEVDIGHWLLSVIDVSSWFPYLVLLTKEGKLYLCIYINI